MIKSGSRTPPEPRNSQVTGHNALSPWCWGQAWLREEQTPASREAKLANSGRHRRAPEERSSYRELFAVGEFRAL